jgi:nicotinamidase-related amidase
MMNRFVLESEDAVILIIDLQERLMNSMKDREKVYKNSNLLLNLAKEMGIPVIISEQYPKGLGATVDLIKQNLPEDYAYVEKVSFSTCGSGLLEILKDMSRKTVIVAGSETHVCVFQTVRDLIYAGYNVHVSRDAVCSRFDENYENGLDLMKDLGAVVSNTETIVFDLLKMSGTPAFKAISPLLK